MLLTGAPRRVLLSGAAGLIGGEVAGRLLDAGHVVTGLVNRNRDIRRNDGRPVASTPWRAGDSPAGRAQVIQCDLGLDRLGWSAGTWTALASDHDLILHCAAVTAFDADPALHQGVNVEGTGRLLALAQAGAMGFVHVSTAYVCGLRDGAVREAEFDRGQTFANAYEASKAQAERRVRASPAPTVIARPSIVVGESEQGAIRTFDTIYILLKLFAEGRLRTMPAAPGATLDLVPIDHVAASLVELVERFDQARGKTFHLVAERPTPVTAFTDTLDLYPDLASPRFVAPESFDPEVLPPIERRFFMRAAAPYAVYFARDPRFDDAGLRAFIGRAPPFVDPAWWRRLVDHALSAGFIHPPKPSIHAP